MAVPTISPERRTAGLKKAAEARAKRAKLRADLKEGRVSLADVLASDDEVIRRTRVKAVLSALPGFGEIRVERALRMCGIAEDRRIGRLGPRQREALIEIAC